MKPLCRVARFLVWMAIIASMVAFWMVVVDETFSKHLQKTAPIVQNVPYK